MSSRVNIDGLEIIRVTEVHAAYIVQGGNVNDQRLVYIEFEWHRIGSFEKLANNVAFIHPFHDVVFFVIFSASCFLQHDEAKIEIESRFNNIMTRIGGFCFYEERMGKSINTLIVLTGRV